MERHTAPDNDITEVELTDTRLLEKKTIAHIMHIVGTLVFMGVIEVAVQ